jgi:septal ring factor EnvC (AmiA/AmiB activator)
MSQKLTAYNQNIQPIIRSIEEQSELLKLFKEENDGAAELVQAIKDAQEALKAYLEDDEESSGILEKKKALETELKEAISAAAKATDFKKADLAKYFKARSKEEGVEKVIDAGNVFTQLEELIN